MNRNSPSISQKPVAYWLFITAFFVFAMAVIGAITRLTESGLSMVEWRPLIGALPPMSETEWNRVFELYQQTPEFRNKNYMMDLAAFKEIFFWEWFHRLWGRLIGLVFFVPMVWFWVRGYFDRGLKIKSVLLLILGAGQGVMGWYMVKSGLVDMPSVSHYRLAAHLSLAFIIFGALIWVGLDVLKPANNVAKKGLIPALISLALITITIIWGAFVAGKDAGLIYNTFPKMGDGLIPDDLLFLTPSWINFIDNHAAIQFTHRYLALGGVAFIVAWVFHRYQESRLFTALGVMIVVQMSLGIATLISGVMIPLAAIHQAGAFICVGLMVCIIHAITQKR